MGWRSSNDRSLPVDGFMPRTGPAAVLRSRRRARVMGVAEDAGGLLTAAVFSSYGHPSADSQEASASLSRVRQQTSRRRWRCREWRREQRVASVPRTGGAADRSSRAQPSRVAKGGGVAKSKRNDGAPAGRRSGRSKGAARDAATKPDITPPDAALGPPERRTRNQERQGILIYVLPEVHRRLKWKALENNTTMQELCARAISRLVETEPAEERDAPDSAAGEERRGSGTPVPDWDTGTRRLTERSELTERERAADDVDRAEWALLDAIRSVREAEEHLARCQVRAHRLSSYRSKGAESRR